MIPFIDVDLTPTETREALRAACVLARAARPVGAPDA